MSRKVLPLTKQLYNYLLANSLRESAALKSLRLETEKMPGWAMQLAPDAAQFLGMLLKIMQAKNVIEIGTFTGYSTLLMAECLPKYGKIITCEVDEKVTRVASQFWQQAGMAHKIDLRLGQANDTLDALLEQGYHGFFDFVFIDADKRGYIDYYEKSYRLLKKGGLIAIDNVLWDGNVLEENPSQKSTAAIQNFNEHVKNDKRVDISMIPIGDGLTLAYKR